MISIASSSDSAWMTDSTGPKISSRATSMSGVTSSMMVGPTKAPAALSPLSSRPSSTTFAPSAAPLSIQERTMSRRSLETSGPTPTPFSRPLPTRSFSAAAIRAGTTRSCALPTVTRTEPAMQRWPAAPKDEPMMFSTVLSMTASGITTMWFLAPPSAWTRLPARAERSYTSFATVDELEDRLLRERDLLGGLEHERVAAGHRERQEPHGHHGREVERADRAEHADRLAVGLAVDVGRDVLEVAALHRRRHGGGALDHLDRAADLGECVGQRLAHVLRDQAGDLLLVLDQRLAQREHAPRALDRG